MINANEQIEAALSTDVSGDTLLLEKKFEYSMEMLSKRFKNEIDALKQQQQSLVNEVDSLKKQMQKLTVGSIITEKQGSAQASPQQGSTHHVPIIAIGSAKYEQDKTEYGSAANSTTQARPRFGDYKPEDVAVDKLFYFGGKRK